MVAGGEGQEGGEGGGERDTHTERNIACVCARVRVHVCMCVWETFREREVQRRSERESNGRASCTMSSYT